MGIVIDLSQIGSNPVAIAWWFFKNIGWMYPVFLFTYGLILIWQNYIRDQYRRKRNYILLAIDIPKNNEQSPRAVENIFSHLAGAHQSLKWREKWWVGEINDSFGFEIISLGGYIQFIIHTRDIYRDLVEATIYSQYPDAEITEVEDYTKKWNITFPNEQYDLWGTELKLKQKEFYPIVTYKEFEDSLAQEFKDPMAGLLESLSRISEGEEIWVQFVITPAENDWGKKAEAAINKIVGAKDTGKKDLFTRVGSFFGFVIDSVVATPQGNGSKSGDAPNQMLYLTPGKKDEVAAIEHKISKIGFHTRIRIIYLAEKAKFDKNKGSKGIYGSFKQFNNLGLNAIKPFDRYLTGGIWFNKERRLVRRKKRILYRYKNRGHFLSPGEYGFILNTEELATLWHFPLLTVKAPLVKKTETKRAEPPMSLPVGQHWATPTASVAAEKASPPDNLPI